MNKLILKFGVLFLLGSGFAYGDSYTYWVDGWRKDKNTKNYDDILVVESASYLFSLDTADLSYAYYAPQKVDFAYGRKSVEYSELLKVKKQNLEFAITTDKAKYVAKMSRAGRKEGFRPLADVLLWESGRVCHHYDFKDVEFLNSRGEVLDVYADIKLAAWDDFFALSLNTHRADAFKDGAVDGVLGSGYCVDKNFLDVPMKGQGVDVFSASIWINLPDKFMQASRRKGTVVYKAKQGRDDGEWGIKVDDIKNFSVYMKVGRTTVESASFLLQDGWNNLSFTYDGKALRFYGNGKQVGKELALSEPFVMGNGDLRFGGKANAKTKSASTEFSMLIDEVKVWDKVLSASEIKDLYKKPESEILPKNIVFEKDFNELKLPKKDNVIKDAKLEISLANLKAEKEIKGEWKMGEKASVTLPVYIKKQADAELKISKNGVDYKVDFDAQKLCYHVFVGADKKRDKEFANATNYDDFNLSVKGKGDVPICLFMKGVASITGLCPILCYEDGTPTGIPVQLSKNWHERSMGAYLMAYAQVPEGKYILRIAYGFYGKYPSASHANLSLIGYGGSGRWEQLAVGAWGETICFDADNSLATNWITDIRMLMARKGENGRMWGWTNAGWGGDWLCIKTANRERLIPVGLKTTYVSQGPCLTEVNYDGFVGEEREISISSTIQTARTDDYARTFQKVKYVFNKEVKAKDYYLYFLKNMEANLVMGNREGLTNEYKGGEKSSEGVHKFELKGEFPLWFSAIGRPKEETKGVGYKAIAIRGLEAKIAGKTYKSVSLVYDEKAKSVSVLLPDNKITNFRRGDYISYDIELFTLHNEAADYYGTNEAYIKHLKENPASYKTTMREALGNNLNVVVKGGELLRNYPVEIVAKAKEVQVKIEGGVGLVPIKFSGLPSKDFALYEVLENGKLVKFDDSVKGNDFYQVNYDTHSKTYTLVYNLPLYEGKIATFILK